ncbi:MAG: PAS domain S-box protein [Deltaproteobacteria bacterium]|nr:PAS domain S-box protein [Deltaproteobacteria bacterium]
MDIPEGGLEKILTIEKSLSGMIDLPQMVNEFKEMKIQLQRIIEDLQGNVNKYRTFLENIPLRLFIKNRDLSYIYCNRSYANDLEKQPRDMIGRTDHDFFPSDLAEKFRGDDQKVLETGAPENIEDQYIVGSQELIVHMVKTPLRDEKGSIVGLMGLFWDITKEKRKKEEALRQLAHIEVLLSDRMDELEETSRRLQQETSERRQVEERLRKLEERHRGLVEKAPVAIAVIQKGVFKFINPRIIELFGFSEEELFSRPVSEFIQSDDRARNKLLFRESNPGEFPDLFYFEIVRQDGTIRWVEDRVDLIQWEGSPATINFFHDITLRKQAEDELADSIQPFRDLIEKAQKVLSLE